MRATETPQSNTAAAERQQHRERVELLGWLLNEFLRRDLGTLPAAAWSRLQKALDRLTWKLVGGGTVFPVTWLKELESKRRSRTRRFKRDDWEHASQSSPPTYLLERQNESKFRAHLPELRRDEIRQLQARLLQVMGALRPTDDPPDLSATPISYVQIPSVIKSVHLMNDLSGGGIKRVYGADWRHLRWLAIATLLEEFGEQIARCGAPGCTELFLRNRRQEYCSRGCSQKVRSSKWYDAHREAAQEKRRQAYRREVKRTSPGARVQVRKRLEPIYPRHMYHAQLPSKYVTNVSEEAALGPEWSDSYIFQHYPKWLRHPDHAETRLVTSAEEAKDLGPGWCDPADQETLKAAAEGGRAKTRPLEERPVQNQAGGSGSRRALGFDSQALPPLLSPVEPSTWLAKTPRFRLSMGVFTRR